MKLQINDYFEQMGEVIYETATTNGVDTAVAGAVREAYLNIFAEYGSKGEQYIYDGEDLMDTIKVVENVHAGITRSIIYILRKVNVDGDFSLLDNPQDEYTVSGNNNTAGMGETSPIDANISLTSSSGGITTPNSKTFNKGNYDATHVRDNYDIRLRAFYEQIIKDNNLYYIVRRHFVQMVYEHNIIF